MSASFGTARKIASPARKANSRESFEPSISEVNLTKEWDSTSSAKLFEQSIAGKLDLKALLTFTTTSEGSVEKYLKIELTDAGISNFQINGSGAGHSRQAPPRCPRPGVVRTGRFASSSSWRAICWSDGESSGCSTGVCLSI